MIGVTGNELPNCDSGPLIHLTFDQGHVTKNQPITALILLSESLATLPGFKP